MSLYNLQSIAAKVARVDATGKKNRLRKSYKGYIGGISGKNEVIARPSDLVAQRRAMSSSEFEREYRLTWLANYPQEDWALQNVLGKEMHPLDMGNLRRALSGITKGDIPGVGFGFVA